MQPGNHAIFVSGRYFVRTILAILIAFSPGINHSDQSRLGVVHQRIASDYPQVKHISGGELSKVLSESDNEIVIFDVREPSEYQVSHLQNAILVDPDISKRQFLELYQGELHGKTVVLYCSVGRRSSILANQVSAELIDGGSKNVFNLEHGIFGWHNERRDLIRRDLINGIAETKYVHPYNRKWGKFIEREALIRYGPE